MKTLLLYIFCLGPIAVLAQTNHILSIKVYDRTESNPVKNARVEVVFEKGFDDVLTDSDGVANFILNRPNRPIVPGEKVSINIYKKDYETLQTDYTIQKNADRLLLNFSKEAKVMVIGYISDPEGDHLEEVEISCLGQFRTTTLKDGFFQLDIPLHVIDETSSTLVLSLQKEGFQDERIRKTLAYGKRTLFLEHQMGETSGKVNLPKVPSDSFQGLVWTTEDLKIEVPNSYCYKDNCAENGRLYTWEAAQRACQKLGEGWRLPTKEEWIGLANTFGGYKSLGVEKGEGDAQLGFQQLKASPFQPSLNGYKKPYKDKYSGMTKTGYYWTATEEESSTGVYFSLSKNGIIKSVKSKTTAMSCRCVKE